MASVLIDVMYGSFTYAGFFAPEEALGTDYFDGSTIWDIDIFSAVNKCLETHAPEDIVVDVALTSSRTLKHVDASNYSSFDMLWRYLHVARYYNVMDGLLRAQFAYPTINWRHVISPSTELPDTRMPLNWTQPDVDAAIQKGYDDAKNAVNNPQNTKDTFSFFALKKKRDPRVYETSFEKFLELQSLGHFDDSTSDKELQEMFLQ